MDIALLVLHVIIGLLFVGHGAQKLFGAFGGHGLDGTAGFFESIGLRPGRANALLAGTAETIGGSLLALGLIVPLAAVLIISVLTAATVTVHAGKGIWNENGGFELPLVLVAVAFTLAAVGGGALSLDAVLGLGLTGAGWAVGALGVGVLGGLGAVGAGRLSASRNAEPAPTA